MIEGLADNIDQKKTIMEEYRSLRKRKQAFKLRQAEHDSLDLYDHLPFQVAVVSNLLQLNRDMAIRQIIELEPRELRVILNIGSYMPISAAEIAYQSRLDAYTISRAVKTLKSLEMIESLQKGENKKVKYLALTDKGEAVYTRLCKVIQQRTQLIESVLSQTEKQQLMETLAKLEDSVEAFLAGQAKAQLANGESLPADQKEILRWRNKSTRRDNNE